MICRFKQFKRFQAPTCFLPRVAGEDVRRRFERSAAVERFELLERS